MQIIKKLNRQTMGTNGINQSLQNTSCYGATIPVITGYYNQSLHFENDYILDEALSEVKKIRHTSKALNVLLKSVDSLNNSDLTRTLMYLRSKCSELFIEGILPREEAIRILDMLYTFFDERQIIKRSSLKYVSADIPKWQDIDNRTVIYKPTTQDIISNPKTVFNASYFVKEGCPVILSGEGLQPMELDNKRTRPIIDIIESTDDSDLVFIETSDPNKVRRLVKSLKTSYI